MEVIIFTDGGSRGNPGQAAIGVVIQGSEKTLYAAGKTIGVATNNEAEYQAILHSLSWLQLNKSEHTITRIIWKLDSKLVVEQLNKKWKIKEPRMLALAQAAWQQLATLSTSYTITHIPREQNAQADALVNEALDALS